MSEPRTFSALFRVEPPPAACSCILVSRECPTKISISLRDKNHVLRCFTGDYTAEFNYATKYLQGSGHRIWNMPRGIEFNSHKNQILYKTSFKWIMNLSSHEFIMLPCNVHVAQKFSLVSWKRPAAPLPAFIVPFGEIERERE